MSSNQKKSRKKKHETESISNFIDKKQQNEEDTEPLRKKNKLSENNKDDSLKFFKNVDTKAQPSTSKSNAATDFINKPSTSKQSQPKKSQSKVTKKSNKKRSKLQGDIRQALSKQDRLLYHAISDTCQNDGVDPYEMQLALAISESLKDLQEVKTQEKLESPTPSKNKMQSITSVLEKYGFKSKKVYSDYEIEMIMNNKSTKRSKYQKFPTLLTNTSDEKRDEMIRNRVDDVMNSHLFAEINNEGHPKKDPVVYSLYLTELFESYRTVFKRSSTENTVIADFYVSSLFDQSNVKAGHLLKDWRSIIGRDASPEREKCRVVYEEIDVDFHESGFLMDEGMMKTSQCDQDFIEDQEDGQFFLEDNKKVGKMSEKEENVHRTLEEVVEIHKAQNHTNQHRKLTKEPQTFLLEYKDEPQKFEKPRKDGHQNVQDHEKFLETTNDKTQVENRLLDINPQQNSFEAIENAQLSLQDNNHTQDDLQYHKNQQNQDLEVSTKPISLNSSCSDIFEGVDSFSLDQIDDNSQNNIADNGTYKYIGQNVMEISSNLNLLHERLTQTQKMDEKGQNCENAIDLTQEDTIGSNTTEVYDIFEETDGLNIKSEEEIHDLTQDEYPVGPEYDRDLRTSQSNMDLITNCNQINEFIETKQTNQSIVAQTSQFIENKHTSQSSENSVINLTQSSKDSDDCKDYQFQSKSINNKLTNQSENIENSNSNCSDDLIYNLTQCQDFPCVPETSKKSSFDENEVIDISDEEVNYSINRFQNHEDFSSETQPDDQFMEIDNLVEESLLDVAKKDDNTEINHSVLELLMNFDENRTSVGHSRKSRSILLMENDDSIANIIKKYGVAVESPKVRKSFTKIQSESDLERKLQESAAGDAVDLSIINEDEFSQNNSQQLNESINQSLASILNSPMITNKRQRKSSRKSLGIVMNEKYVVDTEGNYQEPDYSSMTPNELKMELFKYGIRPLSVKKAIELLTHIYNQIHPKIRIAMDEEVDFEDSRRAMNLTDVASNIAMAGDCDEFVFQLDECGILDDEEYVLPKMKKSKVPSCSIPLHISFYNMIRSNDKLQKYILEFRPLDLDQIYKHFRKFDLTYQLNDIIAFLDKRCITFKTKEQSYSKKHERKKQKKTQKI